MLEILARFKKFSSFIIRPKNFILSAFILVSITIIIVSYVFLSFYRSTFESDIINSEKVKIDSMLQAGRNLAFSEKTTSTYLITEALLMALEINYPRGVAEAYRLNSILSYSDRNYLKSLEYLEMAKREFEKINDSSGLADVNIWYGHIFLDFNKLELSENHFKAAFDYYQESDKKGRFWVAANVYAKVLSRNGKVDKASEILKLGTENIPIGIGQIEYANYLNLKSSILIESGFPQEAIPVLNQAMKIFIGRKDGTSKSSMIETLYYLSKAHDHLGNIDSSEYYLNSSINNPYLFDAKGFSDSVYRDLLKLRLEKKDYKSTAKDIADYFSLKAKSEIDVFDTRAEFNYNFLNNAELVQENIALKKSKKLGLYINIFSFIFIVSISGSFGAIFYQKKRKDRLNFILGNQKNRYINLFENSPNPKFIINASGQIIEVNKMAKDFATNYPSNLLDEIISTVLMNVEVCNNKSNEFFDIEQKDLCLRIHYLIDITSDEIEYTILIEDFSDLKISEVENSNLSELLNQSFEIGNLGSFNFQVNPALEMDYIGGSRNTFSILGLSEENKSENKLSDIFEDDELQRFIKIINDYANKNTYFDFSAKIKSTNQKQTWIRLFGKSSKIDVGLIFVSGLLQDISLEKRLLINIEENLQKEKELNILKSKFISMTSHEFRTPVAVASSSLDILDMYAEEIKNSKFYNHLTVHSSRIMEQFKKITNLLDDILILERTSLTDNNLNNKTVYIDKFIENLLDEFNLTLKEREIVLVKSGSDFILNTDFMLFEYVVNNLVSNAIKFSEGRPDPIIELSFNHSDKYLKITDYGVGIPESDIPFVFNTFYRANNTGTIKGTGLGLTIVKDICDKLNYSIEVQSELGQGTVFTIRF